MIMQWRWSFSATARMRRMILPVTVQGSVGEVEPRHIHAQQHQPFQDGLRAGGRADGACKRSNLVLENVGWAHHVQIDIYQTAAQMLTGFDSCSMVAIFPECPLALFALIIFLSGSAVESRWGWFWVLIVLHQQMDMIGGNRIV
jgi:hypothetical protein